MTEKKRYPPLIVSERFRKTSDYTAPKSGHHTIKGQTRDRVLHAQHIQSTLEKAWTEADESRKVVGEKTPHGVYLEFEIDTRHRCQAHSCSKSL